MIEIDLLNHLGENVSSVNGRVFANIMHQNTQKPALVYTVTREEISGGIKCVDSNKRDRDWVIYIYSDRYIEAKEIKNEVADALRSFQHVVKNIIAEDGFDEEAELFVQIITFKT